MQIKTVSVKYARKQNLGDFCSADIECSLWADVSPEDDEAAVMEALWTMAKANVKAQLVPLTSKSTTVRDFYLGLPVSTGPDPTPVFGEPVPVTTPPHNRNGVK